MERGGVGMHGGNPWSGISRDERGGGTFDRFRKVLHLTAFGK